MSFYLLRTLRLCSARTILSLWLCAWVGTASANGNVEVLQQNLHLLLSKNSSQKQLAIDNISQSDAVQKRKWLEALLEGELYQRKSDDELVYATKAGSQLVMISVVSGDDLGTIKKRKLRKIKINNKLRKHLHNTLAGLDLTAENPAERLAAIKRCQGCRRDCIGYC